MSDGEFNPTTTTAMALGLNLTLGSASAEAAAASSSLRSQLLQRLKPPTASSSSSSSRLSFGMDRLLAGKKEETLKEGERGSMKIIRKIW